MRYAVVDIGSNTVRMNIYDVLNDSELPFKRVLTECANLGLVNYVEKRIMTDDGIFNLIDSLDSFREIAENVSCDKIFYFATACLRNIDNTDDVLKLINERASINIELISGENEALLSFEGLKHSFGDMLKSGIMIDMGGASTELLGFIDGMAVRALSMPYGCLSLYKKFVSNILPSEAEIKQIKRFVDKNTKNIYWLNNYGECSYIVGGTARAAGRLCGLILKNGSCENICLMTYDELKSLYDCIKAPGSDIIKLMTRAVPDRLHTIVPGVAALLRILKYSGVKTIAVSPTGIREGYLSERILKS